ncbi:MAG: hypothetical protein RSG77_14205 [Hafnia sp.]
METLYIVGITISCALLGSWKKSSILAPTARATGLGKVLMGVLLIAFLVPFSTVVTFSLVKPVSHQLMLATACGAFTYGYLHELIRLITFKPITHMGTS